MLVVSLAALFALVVCTGILFSSCEGDKNSSQKVQHKSTVARREGFIKEPMLQWPTSIPGGDTKKWDVCIVGAGLSGSVLAERYATLLNKSSLVIEQRDHIGGNCYDYVDEETGIRVSKYGPHLFHTNIERVWRYVNKKEFGTKWQRWDHEVKAWVEDGKLVAVPVNINTVNTLFDMNLRTPEEMDAWLQKTQVNLLSFSYTLQTCFSNIFSRAYVCVCV
jgi:hypothetical protein